MLFALRFNHPDVARAIIKATSDIDMALSVIDSSGYTILHYAAFCNDDDLLDEMNSMSSLDYLTENSDNPSCSTPLHYAASNGNYKVVRWLLEHGASPNTENCMGQIPLLLAVKNNHIECVDLLLDISPVKEPDNYGQLAIHYAAVNTNLEMLDKVFKSYPDGIKKADTNGNYPYHNAVKSNDKDVLDFFYGHENGKSLLVKKNSNGMTPLMLAVACNASESVQYLLDMGASYYVQTMSGTTPFLLACAYGKLEMAQMLFNNDPSVINDKDKNGNTAAHFAVQNNQLETLRWIRSCCG